MKSISHSATRCAGRDVADAGKPSGVVQGRFGNVAAVLGRHRWNIAAVALSRVAAVIGTAVGIRLLTQFADPSVYGRFKLVDGVAVFAAGLTIRPVTQFLMRYYHEASAKGQSHEFLAYFQRQTVRLTAVCAVLLCAGYAVAIWFADDGMGVALGAGLLFAARSATTWEKSLLITRNAQVSASILSSVEGFLPLIAAALAVYWLGAQAPGVVLSVAGALAVLAAAFWSRTVVRGKTHSMPPADRSEAWRRSAVRFILPLVPVGVFSWVLSVGDRYLLDYFRGPQEVGVYSAVYGLVSGPMILGAGMLSQLFKPLVFRDVSGGRGVASQRKERLFRLMTLAIGVVAFLGVLLLGGWLSRLLLGPQYRANAATLMSWIVLGHAALIFAQSYDLSCYVRFKTHIITAAAAAAAVVNVILNLLWIPEAGALGAAQATLASYVVYALVVARGESVVGGIARLTRGSGGRR